MSRAATALVWIGIVLFIGAYVFPLWSIRLDAPQYPEGIGMNIWISRITGEKPNDLRTINALNHYIGMKEIHPESIAELRFMKYIVAALMALGVVAALLRKRWALAAWVGVAVAAALIGLADFYRWSYDYGHDLDPDAPIKVPGMTYQPPLLGTKKLLNITATSYPALGGVMLIVGVGLAVLALAIGGRRFRRRRPSEKKEASYVSRVAVSVSALLLLLSCSTAGRPIKFGTDTCDYCRMTISDQRYGSEIVTKKGRVYTYDAVECMASAVLSEAVDERSVGMYLTVDYATPARLVDATTATYLRSAALRSPMGMNLTSFARRSDAEGAAERYSGELLTWDEARSVVERSRERGGRAGP